jgi:two-component system, NtrC family, sensor kinase
MENHPATLFCALVEQVDVGVIVLDAELNILNWNRFISQRSGKNLRKAAGRPFTHVFPEADANAVARMVELARDRNKDAHNHWLECPPLLQLAGYALGDSDHSLQSTLLFKFSPTDGQHCYGLLIYDTQKATKSRERLETALVALKNKQHEQDRLLAKLDVVNGQLLQPEKLATISQLAAGVAHEINNPIGFVFSNLRSLNNYVNDLLKLVDAMDDATSLEQLRALKNSLEYEYIKSDVKSLAYESEDGIERVNRIIGALKDFSHIDEEDFQSVDLHRGLDRTLNMVNNQLKCKAEVTKEYGDLPEVECIPSQINQVVMNLLINAAHAIDQFGRITLRTASDGEWAWIEVEDSGSGIPPEALTRIFEPFFTTKPFSTGKGAGLGLCLSQSIVQMHGGRIEVHSDVGVGTRIRITLPIEQVLEQPEPAEREAC